MQRPLLLENEQRNARRALSVYVAAKSRVVSLRGARWFARSSGPGTDGTVLHAFDSTHLIRQGRAARSIRAHPCAFVCETRSKEDPYRAERRGNCDAE